DEQLQDVSRKLDLDSVRVAIEDNFLNQEIRKWLTQQDDEKSQAKSNTWGMVLGIHRNKHNAIATSYNNVVTNLMQDHQQLQRDEESHQLSEQNLGSLERNLKRAREASQNNKAETSSSSQKNE